MKEVLPTHAIKAYPRKLKTIHGRRAKGEIPDLHVVERFGYGIKEVALEHEGILWTCPVLADTLTRRGGHVVVMSPFGLLYYAEPLYLADGKGWTIGDNPAPVTAAWFHAQRRLTARRTEETKAEAQRTALAAMKEFASAPWL